MADLFAPEEGGWLERLSSGAVLLHRRASDIDALLLAEVEALLRQAPPRGMQTPGGRAMSVITSSCGGYGWVSDARGYRYAERDPLSGLPWPAMPAPFRALAEAAAAEAGFPGFAPDACLINCYAPGAKMSLHQDKDERDFSAPIVSVSLGLPAVFLFGGFSRAERRPHRVAPWRCAGVGRAGPHAFPRGVAGGGGRAPFAGAAPHQSDFSQGALIHG